MGEQGQESSTNAAIVNDDETLALATRISAQADSFEGYEITPEEIFEAIQVANGTQQDGGKELHSFVISKTFSSENVVILLNIRRAKNGEWVLDKTIAQGLKPETYGGVVSIDKYGNDEIPPCQTTEVTPVTEPQPITSPREITDESTNISCLGESLRKLESHVANMNKEIKAVRKLIGTLHLPGCEEQVAVDTCGSASIPFDELSFAEKFFKMLDSLVYEEPCEECPESVPQIEACAESKVSSWLNSVMGEVGFPSELSDTIYDATMPSTSAAAVLSASKALISQANSQLLETFRSIAAVSGVAGNKILEDVPPNEDQGPTSEFPEITELAEQLEEEMQILSIVNSPTESHSMQLNIEPRSIIEEYIAGVTDNLGPTAESLEVTHHAEKSEEIPITSIVDPPLIQPNIEATANTEDYLEDPNDEQDPTSEFPETNQQALMPEEIPLSIFVDPSSESPSMQLNIEPESNLEDYLLGMNDEQGHSPESVEITQQAEVEEEIPALSTADPPKAHLPLSRNSESNKEDNPVAWNGEQGFTDSLQQDEVPALSNAEALQESLEDQSMEPESIPFTEEEYLVNDDDEQGPTPENTQQEELAEEDMPNSST